MKITRARLQEFFATPLPEIGALSDAFTFHAFEIDSIEGDLLDIKVLPNRAADCATDEGMALELSAILDVPLTEEHELSYDTAPVETSLAELNSILGTDFSEQEVDDVFRRLRFQVVKDAGAYRVAAPSPRNDMTCSADVAEEVGRILGYDRIGAATLPTSELALQARFRGIERMKDELVAQGFTEVSTQTFTKDGDVELANPLDSTRPWLRTSLEANLADALAKAKLSAPLVLEPSQKPKLFEVGSVFPASGEYLELRMTESVPAWGDMTTDNLSVAKLEEYGKDYEPLRYELGMYKPFSVYPFITRDIAAWMPAETTAASVEELIRREGGALVSRISFVDRFEKEGRVSLAFRIILQAMDRTLTDEDANAVMKKITDAFTALGYEVR